jgi:hypothetical protein
VAGVPNVAQKGCRNLGDPMPYYARSRHSGSHPQPVADESLAPWRNLARILTRMEPTSLSEDERDELLAVALRKVLELSEDHSIKPTGKLLPWPEPKPGALTLSKSFDIAPDVD